jgi:hypothetical protein
MKIQAQSLYSITVFTKILCLLISDIFLCSQLLYTIGKLIKKCIFVLKNLSFLENLLYCSEGESKIRYILTKNVLNLYTYFISVHY